MALGGDGYGVGGEGADRRPALGLAAAALALVAVPAISLLTPPSDHPLDEGPEPYLAAAQEIDAFWRREFAFQYPEADEAYFTPRVVFAEDASRHAATLGDYAGYYNEAAETIRIVIDEPATFVFFVIAHEFGHHAQALADLSDERERQMRSSWSDSRRLAITMRYELQAECLSGVWAADAAAQGRIISRADVEHWRAALALGRDSMTHGRADQRLRWFDAGYQSGDASACDTLSLSPAEL